MSLLSNSLLAVILVGLTGSTGCALTGRTRPQSVVAPASPQERSWTSKSSGSERWPDEGEPRRHLRVPRSYFAHDVEVLHEMLRQTAASASVSPEAAGPGRARHPCAGSSSRTSNNEGFVVACVAWALTDA